MLLLFFLRICVLLLLLFSGSSGVLELGRDTRSSVHGFNHQCRRATAAVADRRHAHFAAPLLQHAEERDNDAGAAAADRVAQCHGALPPRRKQGAGRRRLTCVMLHIYRASARGTNASLTRLRLRHCQRLLATAAGEPAGERAPR